MLKTAGLTEKIGHKKIMNLAEFAREFFSCIGHVCFTNINLKL
jgi:hypothetical protein